MTTFSAETYQNEYLPVGGREVNAVVTVVAEGGGAPSPASTARAEVVIIDVSGSMRHPRPKLDAAKRATAAAIDCIRDGVLFGIIAGSDTAERLYPSGTTLVAASPETRAGAKAVVSTLDASGGTAIGRWLTEARNWFAAHEGAIRHAILLTDGRNESETPQYFDAAVRACEGVFQCDCRGVGTDWQVSELREVASRLLGTVDIVAEPEDMPADFASIMRDAMGKRTADVSLRLQTPRSASVSFVKQVSPTIEDLTSRGVRIDDRTVDYPTGAWGDETRDYHVAITVEPGAVGDEMRAGLVSLVVDGQVVPKSESQVKATWTDDVAASTRLNPQVAHYTGQAELASAIAEGLEARAAGDVSAATSRFGRAAQLAAETGNDGTMQLLARVVDIEDAATGTVRLKRDVAAADEMALDTRSTKTVRVKPTG